MFLHRLTKDVAKEFRIPYYSINDDRYYEEIRSSSWKSFIEDGDKQGCFGPIRAGVTNAIFPDNLSEYSILLHLRDPRDVLTSLFYSSIYNHPRQKGRYDPGDEKIKEWEKMGIDRFVLEQLPPLKENYQLLCNALLGNSKSHLLKYEDMVLSYTSWLDNFLAAFSHLEVPPAGWPPLIRLPNSEERIKDRLVRKYRDDFTPPRAEDIYSHKRRITPGDYRDKLGPDTIEVLNRELGAILDTLSYR